MLSGRVSLESESRVWPKLRIKWGKWAGLQPEPGSSACFDKLNHARNSGGIGHCLFAAAFVSLCLFLIP